MRRLSVLVVSLAMAACQSPDLEQLQAENAALQARLTTAQAQVEAARQKGERLQQDNAELRRLLGLLEQEKSVRVAQSSTLKWQVRSFIQTEMDDLRRFLLQSDLLDYLGAELVQRPALDDVPLVLVDLAHPLPRPGMLTGVGGHFARAGQLQVLLLRPVEQGLLNVWRSQMIAVPAAGLQRFDFSVSVGVETGDIVAYRFPERGLVPYDSGTGDTRFRRRADLVTGELVTLAQLEGARDRRAYSIGVFGLLTGN